LESNALSRYAQLQKKYQAILGGREPLLLRTTMGNAAIWHRISIAADTREAAETLCSRLRTAAVVASSRATKRFQTYTRLVIARVARCGG
jgi:hypothetical protein